MQEPCGKGASDPILTFSLAEHIVRWFRSVGRSASSIDVHPNALILVFNLGVGFVVTLGVGLWPALRAAGTHPALDLKVVDRSVASRQFGGFVVTLQVAVSACLVAAALLLGGSLARFLTEDPGFSAKGTAFASLDLAPADAARHERIVDELLRKVRQKPGILSAGFSDTQPLSGFFGANRLFGVDSNGEVHTDTTVLSRWVSPGYFNAVGTRMLRGESMAQVAQGAISQCVLSDGFAATIFPGQEAIGRIVYASTAGKPDGAIRDPKAGCLVVGVAENARIVSLRAPIPHVIYKIISPLDTSDENRALFARLAIHLVVRARSEALAITALQDAVKETIPGAQEVRYSTFRQLEDTDLNRERMLVGVSGSLAALAMLLTALGLYALLMRSAELRTREIGIRIALGARKSEVVLAIARRTLLDIAIGLVSGEAVAFLLVRGIRELLGVSQPIDANPYLWSSAILIAVGAIAFLFPIRRITSVDPVRALRAE
jgi:putative ABC transport system permease protein